MSIPSLLVRGGDELPVVGLGMWKVPQDACERLVVEAVATGYRHFDCACDYGNERQVGNGLNKAVRNGLCRRDELWVTSKLWNTYHRPEHVTLACKKSLSDLQLDELDLYLIHFPIAQRFVPVDVRYPPGWFFDPDAPAPRMELDRVPIIETWQAMQDLKAKGLVRNIGVSNFGVALLRDLKNSSDDPPVVLQVESHPYLSQEKLLRYCREQGIIYTAFSPLGALSYHALGMADPTDSLLGRPEIQELAVAHGRTPAQVLLRRAVQRGTAVIPKTTNYQRLRENISVFDFALSDGDMARISRLNRNHRYNDPGTFCEAAFNTFCPIYE